MKIVVVNKNLGTLFTKCLVLLTVYFLNTVSGATEYGESLKTVNMVICNKKTCYRLITSELSRGAISDLYSFENSSLDILNKDNTKTSQIQADEGFYDPDLQIFVLRRNSDSSWKEITISTINNNMKHYY